MYRYFADVTPGDILSETLNDYRVIGVLIAYYLADTRRNCRVLCIQMLGTLGSLLPSSARRSMANAIPATLASDVARLSAENNDAELLMYSAVLLTALITATQDNDAEPLFTTLRGAIGDDETVGRLFGALMRRIEAGVEAQGEISG